MAGTSPAMTVLANTTNYGAPFANVLQACTVPC